MRVSGRVLFPVGTVFYVSGKLHKVLEIKSPTELVVRKLPWYKSVLKKTTWKVQDIISKVTGYIVFGIGIVAIIVVLSAWYVTEHFRWIP